MNDKEEHWLQYMARRDQMISAVQVVAIIDQIKAAHRTEVDETIADAQDDHQSLINLANDLIDLPQNESNSDALARLIYRARQLTGRELWQRCPAGCSLAGYDTASGFPGGHRCATCHMKGNELHPGYVPSQGVHQVKTRANGQKQYINAQGIEAFEWAELQKAGE